MESVKIKFVDFWIGFNYKTNNFIRALESKYNIIVLENDEKEKPDLLFYSAFGNEHYKYDQCIKIYYTGENDVPDFNLCDYAISFQRMDFSGRHLRYPLYMLYEVDRATNSPHISKENALNRGFCSLLMRNYQSCSPKRLEIIDCVDDYKPLAYGGSFRNNVGGPIPADEKLDFISRYKFNLALENTAMEGYITEKIVASLAAFTVPIYWGAPDIERDFNPESYINVNDYSTLSSFISDLKEIDNDPIRYLKILHSSRLKADMDFDYNERLSEFLCKIAKDRIPKRPRYAMTQHISRKRSLLDTIFDNPYLLKVLSLIKRQS